MVVMSLGWRITGGSLSSIGLVSRADCGEWLVEAENFFRPAGSVFTYFLIQGVPQALSNIGLQSRETTVCVFPGLSIV